MGFPLARTVPAILEKHRTPGRLLGTRRSGRLNSGLPVKFDVAASGESDLFAIK
jgi:hypothetical protein